MWSRTYSVDEVGGLGGPASWNVFVLDLNLLGENVVSDLLSRLADIRTLQDKQRMRVNGCLNLLLLILHAATLRSSELKNVRV